MNQAASDAGARLRSTWGFLPRLFQSPGREPAIELTARILLDGNSLDRSSQEFLLFYTASAAGCGYWASIHFQVLVLLGMDEDLLEAAASAPESAPLGPARQALARFASELLVCRNSNTSPLREAGFTEGMIQDAALTFALGCHLAFLAAESDPQPDFGPWTVPPPCLRHVCTGAVAAESLDTLLGSALARRPEWELPPSFGATPPLPAADFPHPTPIETRLPLWETDPDRELVEAARLGDTDAFEKLVHRHGRRVYRTLAGILGDQEEARDVTQETFLKAFRRMGSFEGRAKFSTWLLSIGANAAIERIRARKPVDSLDETRAGDEGEFRPRLLQAWTDSPEQRYAKAEMRELVQREVRRLPLIYRTVVVLRDIEQLSTQEAADALGLGIPTIKSRLLRARLLLREALSPHFAAPKGATR